MLIGFVNGHTRVLGRGRGYNSLPIRDQVGPHGPCMVSAWEPDPGEVAKIIAGAKIYLNVLGTVHPPVLLTVGDPA